MTQAGNRLDPSTWPVALQQAMSALPDAPRMVVALSGGLDSVFLLNVAAAWFADRAEGVVSALHINHQLQVAARDMAEQSRLACDLLGIPLTQVSVDVDAGESLENEARKARYRAFEQHLGPGDCLLMAHHADDQAETVLFRLVRGAGVRGLAGMPQSRPLGAGRLCRPLLGMPRSEIEALARQWALQWFDDPTNEDTGYDRNYLRHQVLGPLTHRWPGVIGSIGRTARQCDEARQLTARLAALQRRDIEDDRQRLSVAGLTALDLSEQKNLLRWWLIDCGYEPPPAARLEQAMADLLSAGPDREPELRGAGYCVRRYQGKLYCLRDHGVAPASNVAWVTDEILPWAGGAVKAIGGGQGLTLTVTARQGGERLRPLPGGPSRPLKKWLQEQGVPPWERDCIPLIWQDDELVAVGDLWVSPILIEATGVASWRIVWERDCH